MLRYQLWTDFDDFELTINKRAHRVQVSRNCVELSRVVRGFYDLEEAALVLEPAAAVAAFSRYSRRFGDVLSLGAFDHVGKHTRCDLQLLSVQMNGVGIPT